MCIDEALNVVISTINANTHVLVHVDLHEIYLLDVKNIDMYMFNQCYCCYSKRILDVADNKYAESAAVPMLTLDASKIGLSLRVKFSVIQ
jgi:hypothetical protein